MSIWKPLPAWDDRESGQCYISDPLSFGPEIDGASKQIVCYVAQSGLITIQDQIGNFYDSDPFSPTADIHWWVPAMLELIEIGREIYGEGWGPQYEALLSRRGPQGIRDLETRGVIVQAIEIQGH